MTKVYKLLIIGIFCAIIPGLSGAAETLSSLEEQMTGEEFERAGLDKLSAEELRYLNQWLDRRSALPDATPAPSPEARPAPEPTANPVAEGFRPRDAKVERKTITSRIDGEFTGWTGRTVFKLQNGQIWRQTDGKSFRHNSVNPEVRIEPKSMNTWRMYVEGVNRGVKVTRVE